MHAAFESAHATKKLDLTMKMLTCVSFGIVVLATVGEYHLLRTFGVRFQRVPLVVVCCRVRSNAAVWLCGGQRVVHVRVGWGASLTFSPPPPSVLAWFCDSVVPARVFTCLNLQQLVLTSNQINQLPV